jgi:putative ABC transport system ATP-binding protein
MLKATSVKKVFLSGDVKVAAVDDVSFSVPQGAFVSIVGRSGSGKTTLLNLLGGLEKPTSGTVTVDDQDVSSLGDHALIKYRSKTIGFIFQSYNLIPNLSALENVMLSMEAAGVPKRERKERAVRLLNQVELRTDKQLRKPSRLSGGEQQRVAIARALANKPKLILADEPTGNLDDQTGTVIFELLRSLAKSEKTTIVVVTHDLDIAKQTDRVLSLKNGKLEEV